MGVWVQTTLQVALPPVIPSVVHGSPSSQEVGHVDGGSQVSPLSKMPLPQVEGQSASCFCVHPAGQQPSPATQVVMGVWVQATSQVALLPVILSLVQTLPSSQVVGQEVCGSQVSLVSTTPLPQIGGQSESALVGLVLHPTGQQPSPETQVVMAVWVQATLQLALLPVI
jgi:hypothetical protein